MDTVKLGRTGLVVAKNGFGALPIQRIPADEAGRLLRKALDNGFDYIDTARAYTDSEEKIGLSVADRRDRFTLATKTGAQTAAAFWKDLETSLRLMRTDRIDVYQFHNPGFVPKPGDGTGLYEAMLEARSQGKIRFIGITNHRLALAREAVESGLYDTLQFPFSYLSSDEERALVALCAERDVGFIAMKALAGGLITDAAAAYAFQAGVPNALPIWGIQRERELDEFIACGANPPPMTPALEARIAKDRAEIAGDFCRGCGYCMPCPAGIEINNCARMSLLLRRAPRNVYLTEAFREKMEKIENCRKCGGCKSRCPYHLDTPALLRENLEDFRREWAKKELIGEIRRLKEERGAVILAHNYTEGDVQDIADFVGDSLELSRKAANCKAGVIVFCGVRFMAETAKILSPDAIVLHPAPDAGCPMADMADPEEVRKYRAGHPDTVMVAYVNTTAATKTAVDICCTSGNAEKIIRSIPADKKIMFLPDANLGGNIAKKLNRPMDLWHGCCPTHNRIGPERIAEARAAHPGALVLVHPECPIATVDAADAALSTGGMLAYVKESPAKEFVVGTETGILHRIRAENPGKTFYPLEPEPTCSNMKKITLANIRDALRDMAPRVELDAETIRLARAPIDRMLEV